MNSYLLSHKPKTMEAAFRQYQLCREQGIDPPDRVMQFMFQYLDGVAASKHKLRVEREGDETIEAYWRVQDLIALGMNQEQALLEVGGAAGKNPDSFKRQYLRWKKKAGPEDGNRGDPTV